MNVKIHTDEHRRLILAICDSDIKGKIFSEDKRQLDLTSAFYDGKEMDEADLSLQLNKAYLINAVGENIIRLLIRKGLTQEEDVIRIAKIPYIQIVAEELK